MRMHLTYDSSLSNAKPSWPYRMTLKQKERQVPPCPDKAFHMWQIEPRFEPHDSKPERKMRFGFGS